MSRPPRPNHPTSGLTLIELVAAMAVFALVAVMGLQALTGSLRLRDRLGARAETAEDLSLALTLLRNDLSAMMPLAFHPPGSSRPQSALVLSPDGTRLGFSIGGQPDLAPLQTRGLHRVEWRVDSARGALTRQVWPVLQPASPTARQPEVTVLQGVRGISLRSHWPDQGWRAGVTSGVAPEAPDPGGGDSDGSLIALTNSYSSTLPNAIEVTLQIDGLGAVTVLEALR